MSRKRPNCRRSSRRCYSSACGTLTMSSSRPTITWRSGATRTAWTPAVPCQRGPEAPSRSLRAAHLPVDGLQQLLRMERLLDLRRAAVDDLLRPRHHDDRDVGEDRILLLLLEELPAV